MDIFIPSLGKHVLDFWFRDTTITWIFPRTGLLFLLSQWCLHSCPQTQNQSTGFLLFGCRCTWCLFGHQDCHKGELHHIHQMAHRLLGPKIVKHGWTWVDPPPFFLLNFNNYSKDPEKSFNNLTLKENIIKRHFKCLLNLMSTWIQRHFKDVGPFATPSSQDQWPQSFSYISAGPSIK